MKPTEHMVHSAKGDYIRKVRLLKGPTDGPRKLCLFLDAEYYLNKMDAVAVLEDLQEKGAIPPVTCLFVSNESAGARHVDYTCHPDFTRFVAHDLVRWARENCHGIAERDHLICGLSLSGLASAYAALMHPEIFPKALCQSGSFWWNDEWLFVHARSMLTQKPQLWISVGDQEREAGVSHPPTDMRQDVSQVEATERLVEELKTLGCPVNYHLFSGGHAIEPWKAELPSTLKWLIGKSA